MSYKKNENLEQNVCSCNKNLSDYINRSSEIILLLH